MANINGIVKPIPDDAEFVEDPTQLAENTSFLKGEKN